MESTGEAAVVFQIRWQPQPDPDGLSPSLDIPDSGTQDWDTKSNFSGSKESIRADDFYTGRWGAQMEPSQQLAREPMHASSDPMSYLPLMGPLSIEAATSPGARHISAEPWNPLGVFGIPPVDTSTQTTYDKSDHTGSKLSISVTYHTGRSQFSKSAASGIGRRVNATTGPLSEKTEYLEMLRSTGLWPVDPQEEQNWSGRGQHVEFKKGEMGKVNELLAFQEFLGSGGSGTVDRVKCGRIYLARKTISTPKRMTKSLAIEEIAHMTRLKHSHIIRLIGSYVLKTDLCLLMYPVADHNLKDFLDALGSPSLDKAKATAMASSCLGFFSCLSSVLRYVHSNWTKHMDIKPHNILVRTRWRYRGGGRSEYHSKVYLSDFGIARSYPSRDTINTDGATVFTRKYAAPEVAQRLHRDLSADVFSLGCVFLEMFAALDDFKAEKLSNAFQETQNPAQFSFTMQQELENLLQSDKSADGSYQGGLSSLQELLEARIPCYKGASVLNSSTLTTILNMLQYSPQQRPAVNDLIEEFGEKACCKTGPDELEAADEDWEHTTERYPNRMIRTEALQYGRQIESDQEQIGSDKLWSQFALSDLTADRHLSGTTSEELEEHMTYRSLLTSHMFGGLY